MPKLVGRIALAGGFLLAALAASVTSAGAVVSDGCSATQQGSSSPVDLNKDEKWHLKKDDNVTGAGATKSELTGVTVSAVNLGIPLPVYSNNDKGSGGSTNQSYHVGDYGRFSRVIYVSGTAGGGACSGHIEIIVDDENPLTTVASLASIVAILLGLLSMLAGLRAGGVGGGILAALGGILAGLGVGILLEEFELLDPSSLAGLAFPIGGLLIGLLLAFALRRQAATAT